MNKEALLTDEFIKNALYRIDESTRMIQKSVAELTDEELWKRPNESSNSIANLMVHLCGNITQYIISGLGETEDTRDRDSEFAVQKGLVKSELLKALEDTIGNAKRIIFDMTPEQLTTMRSVQGFRFSGIGIVMHVVEHYSYHTGQIAFWVKQLKNTDLGFYENTDLNIKNS